MKRYYFLLMLAVAILMVGCDRKYSRTENEGETDTIGVGILKNSQDCKADTFVIFAMEKRENKLLPDVEQVAEGGVSLGEIINGATHSRRIVLLIAILIAVFLSIRLFVSIILKEQERMNLRLVALITLVSGWALYFVGYYFGGTASSVLAYCIRPLIASLSMFVGNTGFQELSDDCTRSVLFMTLFAIVHLSAIMVSAIFVVNFFWRRFQSYLRGKYWLFTRSSAPLNIFFGLGKEHIMLAKSIQEKKKGKERILFIDLPSKDDKQNEGLSLSQLLGFNAYKQEDIRELQGVKYAIKGASGMPSDIEITDSDVFAKIGLRQVRKQICHHQHTRIFFLSNNEVENVNSTISLMSDETLKKNWIDIYCHARNNRENGIVEKMAYLKGANGQLNVHIIDTSALSIQLLKRNVEYQPVSFVEPNTKLGVVDNSFTSLVMGFGETGRDAVRFLYEFGAFVTSKGEKSPFKCYSIDKMMYQLKGDFYNNAPALKNNQEIELLQLSHRSPRFWTWVENVLPQLNYVVISLGDDRSNMQAVTDFFEAACRIRHKSLTNFKIFVRSYSRDNEKQLENLIKFYNSKCGAKDRDGNVISDVLVVFGKAGELFTYDNIIDEETIKRAKEFFRGYAEKSAKDDQWEERHRISVTVKDKEGNDIKVEKPRETVTLNDINAVIRKENQDIANSLHMDTKLKLVGLTRKTARELFWKNDEEIKTEEQLEQKKLLKYIIYVKDVRKTYIKDDRNKDYSKYDGIIKNIAICEHLRWNASHEMIGYMPGDITDEIEKTHDCLKSWYLLPDNIQNYDYNVMEKTVELVINNNTKDNENE